jgi:hypothetical protein
MLTPAPRVRHFSDQSLTNKESPQIHLTTRPIPCASKVSTRPNSAKIAEIITMLRKQQFLLLVLTVLLTLGVAHAQSGRRSSGASPTTPTTATSPTGAKAAEKKPAAELKLQLLVGINRADAFTTTPFYVYDTLLADCIRRLGEAEIVFATAGGNNMNRAEAVKAAKQETTRWVVSLELKSFYAESGRQIKPEQDELYVDYTVIEPVTGKIKRSGRTQRHIYQSGRGGVSIPPQRGPGYSEYSIKQAALEAADKILAGFDIKVRE